MVFCHGCGVTAMGLGAAVSCMASSWCRCSLHMRRLGATAPNGLTHAPCLAKAAIFNGR